MAGAYVGPLGAAFIVTAIAEGKPGLRRWVGRLFKGGFNWRWYALALLGVPAIIVAGTLIVSPGAEVGMSFPPLTALIVYVPVLLIQMVTTGLAEEPGRRDFVLVRHQKLHGLLLGTLILGVLWAVWRLPLLVTDWGEGFGGVNLQTILSFISFCIVFSIFITWIFNRTGDSVPVVMLAHVSVNNFVGMLLLAVITTLSPSVSALLWGIKISFGLVALMLIVMTRGKLGYQPELQDDRGVK
ncbi:MAG: CPBP family glutamic-type intramembrane protease [Rubrobacteraceae bacterium]